MKNFKVLLGIVLVVALVAGNLWLYVFKPDIDAADLIFNTTNGESYSYNEMSGQPILVTFWATSCGVCMADLPHLEALHAKYASKGLQMFSVAMPYDKEEKVRSVAKTASYNVVLDSKAVINNAFGRVMYTPTNVLLSPSGDVVLNETGPFNVVKFENEIKHMLL